MTVFAAVPLITTSSTHELCGFLHTALTLWSTGWRISIHSVLSFINDQSIRSIFVINLSRLKKKNTLKNYNSHLNIRMSNTYCWYIWCSIWFLLKSWRHWRTLNGSDSYFITRLLKLKRIKTLKFIWNINSYY